MPGTRLRQGFDGATVDRHAEASAKAARPGIKAGHDENYGPVLRSADPFLDRPRHDMASLASAANGAGLMTLSFLLTTLIVVASPGTGVLYTLAVALTQGGRASISAAFGCTLGIVP